MTESEFIRHEPCSECGSSDANAIYTDGHTYCFSCHARTAGTGELHTHQMQTNVNFKGSAQRLHKRRISEKTCQFYKILRDETHLRFPYFDSSGRLAGFKIKDKSKNFKYEGQTTDTLFGQHLFPTSGKRITITEGELDAASCYEVMGNWPFVSLPHGAGSAKKDLQKQIPLLQGYQEIVLFFDSDEAGRKAVSEAASILPFGKVKIARLEQYKDASEALQANDKTAIERAIWDAKPYQPDGIVDSKTLLEDVTTPNPPCNHKYKWAGLQEKTHGIRYGELTTITAGTGQGKSTFCRQLATEL